MLRLIVSSPPQLRTPTFEMALRFHGIGYSLLPILRNGSKRPAIAGWKILQAQHPDEQNLAEWFNVPEPMGIAIIHGQVSLNSECIDCDQGDLWSRFSELAYTAVPKLVSAPVIKTPRLEGGYQLIYRNVVPVSGNLKLAERPAPTPERPTARKTLIETRGEGVYTLTIGSPACCHPAKRCYELIAGSFTTLPILTEDERTKFHDIARSFSELPPRTVEEHHVAVDWQQKRAAARADTGDGVSPGAAYNETVSWSDFLTPYGWKLLHELEGVGYWRRPGKTDLWASATTNYAGSDLLYVFSSNAFPLEPDTTYSKFGAFSELCCNDDYRLAANRLNALGFGERVFRDRGVRGS
jgi:hypothetical protein